MKKQKLGFFRKMYLVVTDFRTYPFIVKHEQFRKAFGYLITLVFLLAGVLACHTYLSFQKLISYVSDEYDTLIPEFEYENHQLHMHDSVYRKINANLFVVGDTDYTYQEFQKTPQYEELIAYDVVAFLNQDRFAIEANRELVYEIDFMNYPFSLDKNQLKDIVYQLRYDLKTKLTMFVVVYIASFVSYFLTVLSKLLFVTLVVAVMCSFRGIIIDFRNYMKIAIYAYTLPLIVDVVGTCIVGSGKSYVYYAIVLLTYVYIVYAIRAIRLDAFIMMLSKKNTMRQRPFDMDQEFDENQDTEEENIGENRMHDEDHLDGDDYHDKEE